MYFDVITVIVPVQILSRILSWAILCDNCMTSILLLKKGSQSVLFPLMHAIINAALPTTYLSASVFFLRSVYTFQRMRHIRFFCPWQFLLSCKTDTFIRPTYFFCFMWEAGGMAYFCSSFPRDLQGKACFVHAGSAIFFGWRCLFLWKPNTFDLTLYKMRCTINFRNETFNNE